MADFRSVKTAMWREDDWFQSLDSEERLLFIYLFTNPSASVAGIYKLPLRTIAFESGLALDRCQTILARFTKDNKAYYENGVIWVRRMREHQLPGNISNQVATRLARDVEAIPDCPLKTRYLQAYGAKTEVQIPHPYPMDTVSIPRATDTDTDTDTETDTVVDTDTDTAAAPVSSELAQRTEMIRQYEAVFGQTLSGPTYQQMVGYMKRLQSANSVDWWALAITETTGARRPGWQYMKAVLESWLASGKPAINGKAPAPTANRFVVRVGNEDVYYRTENGIDVEEKRVPAKVAL